MRYIEDLRDKHKGEEIWILGSGPSLDDFPDDFFDKKVTIAINWSIIAFPESTYFHFSHPEIGVYMKKHRPQIFKKSIIVYPIVPPFAKCPKKYGNISKAQLKDPLGLYKNDPFYLRWHWILGNAEKFKKLLKPTVTNIINKQECKYICLSTIVHYAIQIGVILGSKKITLIGCECRIRGNQVFAEKRGMSIFEKDKKLLKQKSQKFSVYKLGTRLLTKAFLPYGIQIRRYYHEKGYENIV